MHCISVSLYHYHCISIRRRGSRPPFCNFHFQLDHDGSDDVAVEIIHVLYLNCPHGEILVCRFMVVEWLTHLAATLKVVGSRPSLGDISAIYFLESMQSLAQRDLHGLCDIVELSATCNVCGVNW